MRPSPLCELHAYLGFQYIRWTVLAEFWPFRLSWTLDVLEALHLQLVLPSQDDGARSKPRESNVLQMNLSNFLQMDLLDVYDGHVLPEMKYLMPLPVSGETS